MDARATLQPLESRYLMADLTLAIDELRSDATAHLTLNGEQLSASPDHLTPRGDLAISNTRRGFKIPAASIEFVGEVGRGSFVFERPDGPGVSVSGPMITLRSSRIAAPQGRFSTARLRVEYAHAIVAVDGVDQTDLEGWTTSLDYAAGRMKRSASALLLTIPFRYAIRTTFMFDGDVQTLDFAMNGKIIALTETAPAQSQSSAAVPEAPTRKRRNASLTD